MIFQLNFSVKEFINASNAVVRCAGDEMHGTAKIQLYDMTHMYNSYSNNQNCQWTETSQEPCVRVARVNICDKLNRTLMCLWRVVL